MKRRDKKKKKETVDNGNVKGDWLVKKISRINANDYHSWDKFDVVICSSVLSYDISNKRKDPIFSC